MLHSHPSRRLKVELPTDVPFEVVYDFFRVYGRIATMTMEKAKKEAIITYVSQQHAIAARNCLHQASLNGLGDLHINYEVYSAYHTIYGWLNNSRAISAIAVLISILLVFLVEPLRLFNVVETLAVGWKDKDEKYLELKEKLEVESKLAELIQSRPESVIFLHGPKGSGKSSLLKSLMHNRKFCVRIDCSKLKFSDGGQSESLFVESFEHSIGFSPSFSAITNLTSYIESFFPVKRNGFKFFSSHCHFSS